MVSGVPFSPPSASLQERQRLETILNLCAEYNRGEGGDLEPPGWASFPGVPGDGPAHRPSLDDVLGGAAAPAAFQLLQKQRESEEENLKEECSSTESTHQEVRTPPPPGPAAALLNGDAQVCALAPTPHLSSLVATQTHLPDLTC